MHNISIWNYLPPGEINLQTEIHSDLEILFDVLGTFELPMGNKESMLTQCIRKPKFKPCMINHSCDF